MPEQGHRYTFGPPKGGWPSFKKKGEPQQICKSCGNPLARAERSDHPELRECFACFFEVDPDQLKL